MSTFYLTPTEHVTALAKEKWSKSDVEGIDHAWVVQDRLGMYLFIGQKLPRVREAINVHAARDEPWSQVSVSGLWESTGKVTRRSGPFVKGRWLVKRCDLEAARLLFESVRNEHRVAIIVGNPYKYWVNDRPASEYQF